jgi:hypothetical protein
MRTLRVFGAALALSGFMAFGMTTVSAAGPGTGGGRSNATICILLQGAFNVQTAAGLTELAANTQAYAASIGCGWAAAPAAE